MKRSPSSHKGENGKVAVVGGSRFMHGAPIFSALAAEASGVDLVYLILPDWHENVAKEMSLNFQVHPFDGDHLQKEDTKSIVELLATMDAAVLGPGVDRSDDDSIAALLDIAAEASCALVLDAGSLQPQTLKLIREKNAVLTPHLGELERMKLSKKNIATAAKEYECVIVLKGEIDYIASSDGSTKEIAGGNAGLTVGGTGDALAGLIAGLIAQKVDPTEAAIMATTIIKKAGDILFEEKGFSYTTRNVIKQIPKLLHAYDGN